jgi:hypothetical protein
MLRKNSLSLVVCSLGELIWKCIAGHEWNMTAASVKVDKRNKDDQQGVLSRVLLFAGAFRLEL